MAKVHNETRLLSCVEVWLLMVHHVGEEEERVAEEKVFIVEALERRMTKDWETEASGEAGALGRRRSRRKQLRSWSPFQEQKVKKSGAEGYWVTRATETC